MIDKTLAARVENALRTVLVQLELAVPEKKRHHGQQYAVQNASRVLKELEVANRTPVQS